MITQLIELICPKEVKLIAVEQVKIASEYVKIDSSAEKAECACSSEIKNLQMVVSFP